MIESTTELRVRYAETDQMGVVYHANYLIWCDIARTELLGELGIRYAALERKGTYLAVSEARLRFLAPARYDDCIRVRTRLARVRSRSVTFRYRVEHAETAELLARAETDLICLDGDRRPVRIPDHLRSLLVSGVADTGGGGTPDGFGGVFHTRESRA